MILGLIFKTIHKFLSQNLFLFHYPFFLNNYLKTHFSSHLHSVVDIFRTAYILS